MPAMPWMLSRARNPSDNLSFERLRCVRLLLRYPDLLELVMAHQFQHVVVNHDGEDSENWNAFYFPLGDARRTLNAFVALLQGFDVQEVEQWEKISSLAPTTASHCEP
jgi:hypothetical protein